MSVFHTMCNPLTVRNIIGHISTFKIITAFFFFLIFISKFCLPYYISH